MPLEMLLVILAACASLAAVAFAWRLAQSSRVSLDRAEQAVRQELRTGRDDAAKAASELRLELTTQLTSQLKGLTDSNEQRLDRLRIALDTQLKQLQEGNEQKLDEMRKTVDEKLQGTLEKRLGESFKLVSERLEAVQRGLGEMQSLATGVGDLKRMLSNVKTRGTFGEVQLGAILEQILTPDQYGRNVQPKPDSREVVEFAVRLPGPDSSRERPVWLPLDAKFPQEDYARLQAAVEAGDADALVAATAALMRTVRMAAQSIQAKYVAPPHTTDFAILFLPTEGLYAEVLREPGFVETLHREFRVVVAGPTTLAALLNSLRMGFRTLAIEQRASEVWKVLAAVKTEFGRFGEVLDRVKRNLDTASNTIESTQVRTRAMERRLRDVEQLPAGESEEILALAAEPLPVDEDD
ncbi:MAG: DNA recombination protein RmuC [Myxococcota bacterium]